MTGRGLRVECAGVLGWLLMGCVGEATNTIEQRVQAGPLMPEVDGVGSRTTLVVPVDATIAATFLTPGRELLLDDQGAAQVWVSVNHCDRFEFDEVDYGPLNFVGVLLAVQGPFEIVQVPGTAITMPTVYYQEIGLFNDSKEVVQYEHKLGLAIKQAKAISLGAPGEGGYVYERGDIGFAWQDEVITDPIPYALGFNVVVYRDDDVTLATERLACVLLDMVTGYAVVSVNPESSLAPFGGPLVAAATSTAGQCLATFATQE